MSVLILLLIYVILVVVFHKDPLFFLIYVNNFNRGSELFDFHLFADDSNIFYKHKNLIALQSDINAELTKINEWLCVNKLALNIDKSNFVIFHPPQRKLPIEPTLEIYGKCLKREFSIKYLGIYIDSHLNWKPQTNHITKKINRSLGILSKLRYYLSVDTLINLYNALIYPFLIYGIVIWENTYPSTHQPLIILQKKATRIMTFSQFDAHSSPLFKSLHVLKFPDYVTLHTAIFMHKFNNNMLSSAFTNFFTPVNRIHTYSTRVASKSSYALTKTRSNYGIFNLRYQGAKV